MGDTNAYHSNALCRALGAHFLFNHNPGLTAGPIICRPFGPEFTFSDRNNLFFANRLCNLLLPHYNQPSSVEWGCLFVVFGARIKLLSLP
jgi:hypothetical protein